MNDFVAIGIVISGIHITFMTMTFNQGSTALLTMLKRFKMPESLNEISRLLPPVLKVMYNCATVIRGNVDKIELITSIVPQESESEEDVYYPLCSRPALLTKEKDQQLPHKASRNILLNAIFVLSLKHHHT